MFWNTSTWTLEFILHEDPAWFVTPGSGGHLRFSPDSTRLYVLSSTGVVAWDVPDRRLAWKTAREDRAHAISIDAACTVILCHGGRLIDARTGAWRRAEYPPIPDKHPGGETFVTISPDGRLVATLASDQMSRFTHGMPTRRWVRARDVDTLELVQELAIDPVPTDPARAQAYMDDFPFPPETKEYDAMDTKVSAPGFFFGIELISYACNGRFLVCYSFDETAYVIDMGGRPWRVQRTIPIRPYKAHHTMSYTPWLVDDPFSHDRRWIVEPANDQDDTLVVRAVDPGRDKHPCDIIKG
ncbi:MAG: hypothetical protein GYA24_14090 [Candidatus Lokiarchaeota archaeon]|nr:hypothetical protein [Candidatus Lokiarchaeota archaeon]